MNLWTSADETRRILQNARVAAKPRFEWYPYDSMSNFVMLRELFAGREDAILQAAQAEGVLDVGCGDGDLAFAFERLGARVTAVDHPSTNYNGMRGVYALRETLGSKIDIRELDLDMHFGLPEGRFGLTLFLGLLYHLKNPFYVLEEISKRTNYCVLSTRVARRFPDGTKFPDRQPIAYLVDHDELNADGSNFWIFSHAGLDRLAKRCYFEELGRSAAGDTRKSTPDSLAHDERVFLLLKSNYGLAHLELVEGFWHAEDSGWRWTQRKFRVDIRKQAAWARTRLVLKTFVPPELLRVDAKVTLHWRANGVPIDPVVFTKPGEQTVTRNLPRIDSESVRIEAELDQSILEEGADGRELGMIVAGLDVLPA